MSEPDGPSVAVEFMTVDRVTAHDGVLSLSARVQVRAGRSSGHVT